MVSTTKIDSDEYKQRIEDNIENQRDKRVDIEGFIDILVTEVEALIDEKRNDEEKKISAAYTEETAEVIENTHLRNIPSHTMRVYSLAFITHNFGLNQKKYTEYDEIQHGDTWEEVTTQLYKDALYQVVNGIVRGKIRQSDHVIGEYMNSLGDSKKRDMLGEMRKVPLANQDVHSLINRLAEEATSKLRGNDTTISNEDEAIDVTMEARGAWELNQIGVIGCASLIDGIEDLYNIDGSISNRSGQLENCSMDGWEPIITTGLAQEAVKTAIKIHREIYKEEFKES